MQTVAYLLLQVHNVTGNKYKFAADDCVDSCYR